MELDKREWLGCVAWDGYPQGIDGIEHVKTEADFRSMVSEQSKREDFASPKRGWPYPWDDDIFLTDYTYAFFDGRLQLTCFHSGWQSLEEHDKENASESETESVDKLPNNVPAPGNYDSGQPDSIMIITRQ